jgi:hypothetical protein
VSQRTFVRLIFAAILIAIGMLVILMLTERADASTQWDNPYVMKTACTEAFMEWPDTPDIPIQPEWKGTAVVDGLPRPIEHYKDGVMVVYYPMGSATIESAVIVTREGGWLGVITIPQPIDCTPTVWFPVISN